MYQESIELTLIFCFKSIKKIQPNHWTSHVSSLMSLVLGVADGWVVILSCLSDSIIRVVDG